MAHSTAWLFEHGDHRRVLFVLVGVFVADRTGVEAAPVVKRPKAAIEATSIAAIATRGARVRPGKSRIRPMSVDAAGRRAQALSAVNDIDRYGSQSGCTFPTATSTHVSACGA